MSFHRSGTFTLLVENQSFSSANKTTTYSLADYVGYKYLIIMYSRIKSGSDTLTINNATPIIQTQLTPSDSQSTGSTRVAIITDITTDSSYSVYGYGTVAFRRTIIGIS